MWLFCKIKITTACIKKKTNFWNNSWNKDLSLFQLCQRMDIMTVQNLSSCRKCLCTYISNVMHVYADDAKVANQPWRRYALSTLRCVRRIGSRLSAEFAFHTCTMQQLLRRLHYNTETTGVFRWEVGQQAEGECNVLILLQRSRGFVSSTLTPPVFSQPMNVN